MVRRAGVIDQLVIDFGKISPADGESYLSKEGLKAVLWNGFIVARVQSLVQTLKSTVDTVESAFELAIATLRSALFGVAFTNRELRENMLDAGVNLITDVTNVVLSVVGVALPVLLVKFKKALDENLGGNFGTNKPIADKA